MPWSSVFNGGLLPPAVSPLLALPLAQTFPGGPQSPSRVRLSMQLSTASVSHPASAETSPAFLWSPRSLQEMQPEKTASLPFPHCSALFPSTLNSPRRPRACSSCPILPAACCPCLLPALPNSCFMQEHPYSHGKCSKVWERISNLF